MADLSVPVRVNIAWWVFPYMKTLVFFCLMMGTEPNYEKVMGMIARRGIRIKVGAVERARD